MDSVAALEKGRHFRAGLVGIHQVLRDSVAKIVSTKTPQDEELKVRAVSDSAMVTHQKSAQKSERESKREKRQKKKEKDRNLIRDWMRGAARGRKGVTNLSALATAQIRRVSKGHCGHHSRTSPRRRRGHLSDLGKAESSLFGCRIRLCRV